ncbi:MAG: metallophosphoesterase, partial [Lentisphaeria bacterium]|nr:metallophosphoesterase [Lentisphaeria bacterium]
DMVSAMIGRNICYDAFLDSLVKNCHQAYYCIRGNHEYRGGASGAFFDLFADPEQRSYFAFQHKGIFFILLDSDGDQRDDSVYIEKQIDWLKKTVGSKEFQQAEYRVVIAHKPLFLGNQIKKIFNQLSVQERNSIDLMITGHVHAYAKVLPGNPLVYAPGNKLDQTEHKQNESFPQLINDASGYILVNKDSEKLSVKVFDRHLKCVDKLLIKRKKSLPNPLKF